MKNKMYKIMFFILFGISLNSAFVQSNNMLEFLENAIVSEKNPSNEGYKTQEEQRYLEDVTNQSILDNSFLNRLCCLLLKKFHYQPQYSNEYKQTLQNERNNRLLDVVLDFILDNPQIQKMVKNNIMSPNEVYDLSLMIKNGVFDNVAGKNLSTLDKYTLIARMLFPTNDKDELYRTRNIIQFLVDNPGITEKMVSYAQERRHCEDFLCLFHNLADCFSRYNFNVKYNLEAFLYYLGTQSADYGIDPNTGIKYATKYSLESSTVQKNVIEDISFLDEINPIYHIVKKSKSVLLQKIFIKYKLKYIMYPVFFYCLWGMFWLSGVSIPHPHITCISLSILVALWIDLGLNLLLSIIIAVILMSFKYIISNFATIVNAVKDLGGNNLGAVALEPLLRLLRLVPCSTIMMVIGVVILYVVLFDILYAISTNGTPVIYKQDEFYKNLFFTHIKTHVLKDMRNYLNSMKNFYLSIRDNSILYKLLSPELTYNGKLFNVEYQDNNSFSDKQKKMFSLIYKEDITDNEIYELLYLFDKNRELFKRCIQEQSYIVPYLQSADHVLSGKYCIAKFSRDKDPRINLIKARHIMLQDKAIPNDVDLGVKSADGFRNWIFNGMNATGKTTMMETIIDAVILAQSIGIAPCKKYSATIFDNIFTAFGAQTDILSNYSKYMSELKQIDYLIKFCRQHKKENIIIGCDEICSATDPESAEVLVVNVFRKLMENKNTVFLAATHYQRPRSIEKQYPKLQCGNYMMSVCQDNAGNLKFLRKLIRGYPKHSLAVDIGKQMIKDKIISPVFNELLTGCENVNMEKAHCC